VGELIARWADEHSFEVRVDSNVSRLSVTSDVDLHRTGDSLLSFCLPIAMAAGARLVIEDEIDERLMRSSSDSGDPVVLAAFEAESSEC
jgi:hypothetical protein